MPEFKEQRRRTRARASASGSRRPSKRRWRASSSCARRPTTRSRPSRPTAAPSSTRRPLTRPGRRACRSRRRIRRSNRVWVAPASLPVAAREGRQSDTRRRCGTKARCARRAGETPAATGPAVLCAALTVTAIGVGDLACRPIRGSAAPAPAACATDERDEVAAARSWPYSAHHEAPDPAAAVVDRDSRASP